MLIHSNQAHCSYKAWISHQWIQIQRLIMNIIIHAARWQSVQREQETSYSIIVYFVQHVNNAGTDGLTYVSLGIDQIRLRSYATSHTRYRVDETGVQEMKCTVRQSWDACMSGEIVLFWNEKGSVQPHSRQDIIGARVHTDCQRTLHVFTLTEVEARALNWVWTQCAGCQSNAGGGGILTAGEKEKQWTELEVIVLPTLLPTRLSETEMGVFYMPWYIWYIILISCQMRSVHCQY